MSVMRARLGIEEVEVLDGDVEGFIVVEIGVVEGGVDGGL